MGNCNARAQVIDSACPKFIKSLHSYTNLYVLRQLEHKILKTFIRTGKLHHWLGKPGNLSGVHRVKKILDKLYLMDFGSSDLNDINSDKGSTQPRHVKAVSSP